MDRPRASEILKLKIELARDAARTVNEGFWSRSDAGALFPLLQVRTYDVARASIPLMRAAQERCRSLAGDDPVAARLVPYLDEHIEEEQHHDVWILDDLEELGISREEVLARTPCATAASLVGAQYYWILHDHPIALVGYMAALEGGVASEEQILRFVVETGIPREGVRTLLLHARVDPDHEAGLARLIDDVALTPHQVTTMGISAVHTISLLASLTLEVLEAQDRLAPAGGRVTRT